MTKKVTRRQALVKSATASASAFAFTYVPPHVWGANDRFYVAGIGVGGKGAGEVRDVTAAGGQFVALCDVDAERAKKTYAANPKAKIYTDFRRLLEKEKGIDAVTVSTPDHTHAVASLLAMSLGKHVYCQKPLTHSIFEARMMARAAAHFQVQTQMGNQAHAGDPIRRAVELVRAGIVGPVREVHAWTNRPIWPQGQTALAERQQNVGAAKPATLEWDLWLGPARSRAYNPCYTPFKWRGWWDFGTGALGDMACHIMDMAYWALDLGAPTHVSATSGDMTKETGPDWATITYHFPSRGKVGGGKLGASVGPVAQVEQPEVKFVWYDGKNGDKPNAPYDLIAQATKEARTSGKAPTPLPQGRRKNNRNSAIDSPGRWDMLLVGDKGTMLFQRGRNDWLVSPASRLEEFTDVPATIARVANEDEEWVQACRGGDKPLSSFDYAGPFTEMVLLGNLAVRLGEKIEWDAENLRVPNVPAADELIRSKYRTGWELPLPAALKQ